MQKKKAATELLFIELSLSTFPGKLFKVEKTEQEGHRIAQKCLYSADQGFWGVCGARSAGGLLGERRGN